MKRLLDLAVSIVGLIVLSPLLVLVASWIVADSPGPVFFRQQRVGRNGRVFKILKFRTMRMRADENGPRITIGADQRVTRSGRVLRRFKIDELPQLLNVLRGDMSLVGPRPELEHYVAMYPPGARQRLASVRPGITGLASLAFRNESDILGKAVDPEVAYVETVLPAKLAYDLKYIEEQSVRLDLVIIVRTIAAVFD